MPSRGTAGIFLLLSDMQHDYSLQQGAELVYPPEPRDAFRIRSAVDEIGATHLPGERRMVVEEPRPFGYVVLQRRQYLIGCRLAPVHDLAVRIPMGVYGDLHGNLVPAYPPEHLPVPDERFPAWDVEVYLVEPHVSAKHHFRLVFADALEELPPPQIRRVLVHASYLRRRLYGKLVCYVQDIVPPFRDRLLRVRQHRVGHTVERPLAGLAPEPSPPFRHAVPHESIRSAPRTPVDMQEVRSRILFFRTKKVPPLGDSRNDRGRTIAT